MTLNWLHLLTLTWMHLLTDCSDPEYEPDHEIIDEDDNDDISICSYDVDAPCVDIGYVFPDVN